MNMPKGREYMKKFIASLLVAVSILGLVGCGDTERKKNETSQPATHENNFSSEQSELVVAEDCLVWVKSADTISKPYEKFLWENIWTGNGWLNADEISIFHELPDISKEFQQITYSDDFEIHYAEGVEFSSLSIYNSDFERIHHNVQPEVLQTLGQGTYYLVIVVSVQGKYIEAEEKYEYSGDECAYKLVLND